MTAATDPSPRRLVYALLITVAAGGVAARIVGVARVNDPGLYRDDPRVVLPALLAPLAAPNAPAAALTLEAGRPVWGPVDPDDPRGLWPATRPKPMPTHGPNDRSRWDTVRALVDNGTYAIGRREVGPEYPKGYRDTGIVTEDGWKTIDVVLHPERQEFYSSKPPLLPTLVAGEYWLLKHAFGWSITADTNYVVRTILLTVNWLPFIVYLVLLARLAERYGRTDWGRYFTVAAGCFGTLVTPFATTFNNHSVATFSALFALYPAMRIWSEAGESARPRLPASLFLLSGFFAGFTVCNELPAAAFTVGLGFLLLLSAPARTLAFFVPAAAVPVAAFLVTNKLAIGEYTPAYEKFGSVWYTYDGSYWKQPEPTKARPGIDWAIRKESKAVYAFHVLAGHHGLFSLSPIFLLALAGSLYLLYRRLRRTYPAEDPALTAVALLGLYLSVVVIGFYTVVTESRNYGGWTNGLRWLMWLTPVWLLTLLPIGDRLAQSRWGRGLGYLLLGVSVLSASYHAGNPWRHPWLFEFLESRGWIAY